MIKQATRNDALKRVSVFIGQWRLELGHSIPSAEAGGGPSLFECEAWSGSTWELDEASGWRKDFDRTYARVDP